MNRPVDTAELASRYAWAQRIGAEAAQHTLHYFQRQNLNVEVKEDQSPVTVADRETEQFLRDRILQEFPEDGILGEEFPSLHGTSPFRWILDPIDGTKSFVCGVPLYGTLLGITCHGEPRIGVIELPALGESVHACSGQGAWHRSHDGQVHPAQVSTCAELSQAVFVTTDRSDFVHRGAGPFYDALESSCRWTRTWGDCYGYTLVATGRADVMVDPIVNLWDAAPLLPILQEAGGCFTDWQGRATIEGKDAMGMNLKLLPQVLRLLP